MDFFKRKTIAEFKRDEEESGSHTSLLPILGPYSLIAIGIGAIIGAGIFVITGVVAAEYAGPGIIVSLIIAGFGCLFAGLCYAEFASMIPVSGSAYSYAYATMGKGIAWLIGLSLMLEYLFAAASVAVGWSGYFSSFAKGLGWDIPESLRSAPLTSIDGHSLTTTGAIINLPAVLLVAVLSVILISGVRHSARATNLMVLVKVGVIVLFIVAGAFYVDAGNWVPFIPENTGDSGHYGWSGVMRGAGVIFVAYLGFDAVSTASQEARNPQRDMPIAILGSLLICTILYISVAAVLTGLISYKELNVPNPIYVAVANVGPALSWLTPIINIGALVGLTSVTFVLIYAQPRIFYAMSRDGMLPPLFSKIHPKFRTPYMGIIVTALCAGTLAGLLPIGLLAEMNSIGTLFAFIVVCAGVMILRRTNPELPRTFRVPFVPLFPLLGIATCGYMMISLSLGAWLRLVIWLVIGMVFYVAYDRLKKRKSLSA